MNIKVHTAPCGYGPASPIHVKQIKLPLISVFHIEMETSFNLVR